VIERVPSDQAMKVVHLLRHAKSSWEDDALPDRERPLAPRGRRAAARLCDRLRRSAFRIDLALCSPSVRTRQTLELLKPALDEHVEIVVEEALYAAGAGVLLDRLRRLPARVDSVLIVGHNPGLQEVAVTLARGGARRDRVRDRFPTAALATLVLRRGEWADLAQGTAELIGYVEPGDLK
jgi:phosphohistidine phosphatase